MRESVTEEALRNCKILFNRYLLSNCSVVLSPLVEGPEGWHSRSKKKFSMTGA